MLDIKKYFSVIMISIALVLMASCDIPKDTSSVDLDPLIQKQELFEKKLNQIVKKIDDLQVSVKKINTAPPSKAADNKKNERPKRKPADPNYVHNIPQGDSYFKGNPNAKVTITEFFDFQWPYCARSVSLIDEVLAKYPNDVKVVFKSFPLSSHKQAFKASKYAIAAGRQGKFNEMFDIIFKDNTWKQLRNNEDLPRELAAELGLDLAQLDKDMNDPAIDAQIQKEYEELKSLGNSYETDQYAGVRLAVPKFFINGREPAGRSLDDWSKVIEEELKK